MSTFRKTYREDFKHLFVEIFQLCRQAEIAEMGEISLDGHRVQGAATLDQNRTREQIEAEIQEILVEAADVDDAEDEEYGAENRGYELPDELQDKESRLKRLRAAKANIDQKEQERKDDQAQKIRKREQEEAELGEPI